MAVTTRRARRRLRHLRPIERVLRPPAPEEEVPTPFLQRVIRPFVQRLINYANAFTPQGMRERIREKLLRAGAAGMQVAELVVLKVLGAGVFLVLALAVLYLSRQLTPPSRLALPSIIFALLFGYKFPDIILTFRIRERQRRIINTLPDMLDLLTVAVEAGLGLDAAMTRVGERMVGPLGEELRRTVQEIHMGKPRREALRDLGWRTGVEDIGIFVSALIQAEELGISIGNVLRVQADRMRERRLMRAREMAQRVPIKIIFPLIFFILPTLFLLMLGPLAINVYNQFRVMAPQITGAMRGLGGGGGR